MSELEAEFPAPVTRVLDAYAPAPKNKGDWDDVLRRIEPPRHAHRGRRAASSTGVRHRARLLLVALLVLVLLAGPTYAIGRSVIAGWLQGKPAPKSIEDNFESYTPALGFRPESGTAVLVASHRGFSLYATANDRGSYCVATTTPDGGICIRPSVAAAPLIAGIMPGDPTRADSPMTTLVAGRVAVPRAVAITFTDPDGRLVKRPIGSSGFFLATLSSRQPSPGGRPYPCKNGNWVPTFRALNASGEEVTSARIELAHAAVEGLVCSWANGPHR